MWADEGWAKSFIEEEQELTRLEEEGKEESDEYVNLCDSMSDQWIEMNEPTRQEVNRLRDSE